MITVKKNDKDISSSFVHVNHFNLNKVRVINVSLKSNISYLPFPLPRKKEINTNSNTKERHLSQLFRASQIKQKIAVPFKKQKGFPHNYP